MRTSVVGARPMRPLLVLLTLVGFAVVAASAGAWAAQRFTDVPTDHAFHDDISWLTDAGIAAGYPDGTYRPAQPVTRQAMAAFVRRVAGQDPDVGPVVDAATVQGLTPDELGADTSQLVARLDAMEDRLEQVEVDNAALEATVAAQDLRIGDLEDALDDTTQELSQVTSLLAGVSRQEDALGRDTLTFAGMNLQVVNGTGNTPLTNGLGNLIVGYDAAPAGGVDRSGSHYLVVGDLHEYTAFGGIVAGHANTVTGDRASVLGGSTNTASGEASTVTGGSANVASGRHGSVSGGRQGLASGGEASVSGGFGGEASGFYSSVVGGSDNLADGERATVSGGRANTATGGHASISGGWNNAVTGLAGSILGGSTQSAPTGYSCHPGC